MKQANMFSAFYSKRNFQNKKIRSDKKGSILQVHGG